ncbi:MAG: hypothetical protein A3J76_06010 [Candidatus Moranbacteria bacterium RBG_13_45_13]|nr:MAG: hypothetical protein A3J76_06010 [Candidatus Moranbacteria bacterium RBG_13_45_13]
MKLSIQIVNYRSRAYLQDCLFSIRKHLPLGMESEVLVINNDKEPLEEWREDPCQEFSFSKIELNENVGFGRAHNIGSEKARGEFILFLNPDTKILPQAISKMMDIFQRHEKVGIVGPVLVDSANRMQADSFGDERTPFSIIGGKVAAQRRQPALQEEIFFEAGWVSGGALLARRDIFEKAGKFDENYFMYFEDVDLCLRVKKLGYKIIVSPLAHVFHESGKSFVSEREKKRHYYASQDYYLRKHFGAFWSGLVKLLRFPYYVKNVWLK